MASQPGVFNPQAFTDSGAPAASYRLYTYAQGTTTHKAAYTDAAGLVAHTYTSDGIGGLYIGLNSRGELPAPLFLASGAYDLTLKTPAGATVWTRYAVGWADLPGALDAALRADLADSADPAKGSALVGHGGRTVGGKLGDFKTLKDFGAACDGVTDDSAAIALAVAWCKTQQSPTLVVGPGDVYIGNTTATFDVPDGTRLVFSGMILSTASGKSAVVIGKSTANSNFIRIDGLQVARATTDTSSGSVGVELLNLVSAIGDLKAVYRFNTGVKVHGNGYGCAYNQFTFGAIRDNRTNVLLTATAGAGNGYCNENVFYGGTFNHNSSYPAVSTVNIQVDDYTNVLNNNRFVMPSLEDNALTAVAAVINGENNFLLWPRMERSTDQANYQIQFTVDSLRCGLIGNGFGLAQTNISDSGSSNEWESIEGTRVQRGTPDAAGKGVIRARSTNTSNARVLLIEDAAGVETVTIRGDGRVTVPTVQSLRTASLPSSYANDAAAAAAGIPVGGFYRNGSAVQIRVS